MFKIIRKKNYEAIVEENKRLKIEYERLVKQSLVEEKPKRKTSALCVGCKHHIEPTFPLSYGECALNRTCTDYEEDTTNE